MATFPTSTPPTSSTLFPSNPTQTNPLFISLPISSHHFHFNFKPFSTFKPSQTLSITKSSKGVVNSTPTTKPRNGVFHILNNDDDYDDTKEILHLFDERQGRSIKFVLLVLVWTSVSLVFTAFSGNNNAHALVASASDSIRASSFGLRFANTLRSSGWPDEAVVFALATLPVVELRGAIPVGYWLQLKPWVLTSFAVLGNMVPVVFIVLYLKRFASFLARSSPPASKFLDLLFRSAKQKAEPIEEFQWLGLMLFVAVPFPGTGAWTGGIIASILDMPFWPALSANFFGVVLAGLLVNLLVNLGLKYAVVTGVILFFISTFMWSALRSIKRSLST